MPLTNEKVVREMGGELEESALVVTKAEKPVRTRTDQIIQLAWFGDMQ